MGDEIFLVVVECPCSSPASNQGTVQQIANGDLMRPLLIECWDYDRTSGHDFIGSCKASIADLQVVSAYEPSLPESPKGIFP